MPFVHTPEPLLTVVTEHPKQCLSRRGWAAGHQSHRRTRQSVPDSVTFRRQLRAPLSLEHSSSLAPHLFIVSFTLDSFISSKASRVSSSGILYKKTRQDPLCYSLCINKSVTCCGTVSLPGLTHGSSFWQGQQCPQLLFPLGVSVLCTSRTGHPLLFHLGLQGIKILFSPCGKVLQSY